MQRSMIETMLGAVVLLVAGLFLAFAYNSSRIGGNSGGGYPLNATFNKIDGISVGSDVRISGIKVGTVTAVSLVPETFQAKLELQVPDTVKLPTDTVVKVESEGLLGGRYISLVPGGEEDILKSGASFTYTESPTSLSDLISRFVFSAAGGQNGAKPASGDAPTAAPAP